MTRAVSAWVVGKWDGLVNRLEAVRQHSPLVYVAMLALPAVLLCVEVWLGGRP